MEMWRIATGFLFCLLLSVVGGMVPVAGAADEGESVFNDVCSQCHNSQMRPLDDIRLTREQWKQMVDKMIDLGAEVPKKKIPQLLDYLVRTRSSGAAPAPAGTAGSK